MIHAVTSKNRHLYRPQIWEMFVERRKAFYEKCGWKDLMVFDGAEVDDFDDDKAVYLLALDETGQVEAGIRTRPTADRCILVDRYPQLIGEGAPPLKGPEVWETTRIFTSDLGRERRSEMRRRSHEVGVASLEYVAAHGGVRTVGMVDLQLFPMVADRCLGEMKIVGPPMQYAYGVMVGTSLEITDGLLEQGRDSLAEPVDVRLFYEVEDEDVAAFGSVMAVERAVDQARRYQTGRNVADRTAQEGAARATALYARHDAALAAGRPRLRLVASEDRAFARPSLAS
jgi:acyl-homoserine lactone synthase